MSGAFVSGLGTLVVVMLLLFMSGFKNQAMAMLVLCEFKGGLCDNCCRVSLPDEVCVFAQLVTKSELDARMQNLFRLLGMPMPSLPEGWHGF